jgi:hypothetical protein
MHARARHIVAASSAALGFTLLGGAVHGMTSIDKTLQAVSQPVHLQQHRVLVEQDGEDCPFRERRPAVTRPGGEV